MLLFGVANSISTDAQRDPGSLFYIIKFMIRTRRRHQSFGKGKLIWIGK